MMSDEKRGLTFDASPELYKPGEAPQAQVAEFGKQMVYDNSPALGGQAVTWELRRTDGSLVTDSRQFPSLRAALEIGLFPRQNLSLRNVDLRGVKLAPGNYQGVDFRGSNVEGMILEGCDARGSAWDDTEGKARLVEVDARHASGLQHLRDGGSMLHRVRGVDQTMEDDAQREEPGTFSNTSPQGPAEVTAQAEEDTK